MTDPTPTAQKLLEQARAGHDPSAADEARVHAALHARVLANPMLLSAKSTHALASVSKLTWGKLVIALGLGGAAVVGAVVVSQGLGSREPAPGARQAATAASVASLVSNAPAPPAAPNATLAPNMGAPTLQTETPTLSGVAPAPSQKHAAATPTVSAGLSPGDMQLEISGLGRAEQLLHAGNAAQALSALDQLAQRVPHGALMEERDATRALAQCALSRSSSVANAFLARYPKSVHEAGVRSACTPD